MLPDGLIPGGFLGVDLFFVLSGFLITALLLGERRTTGRIGLGQFFRRRGLRLLPALWAFLAMHALYAWATNFSMRAGMLSPSSATLTPVTVTVSLYFLASSVMCGMASLHGPHHVAQNSTT